MFLRKGQELSTCEFLDLKEKQRAFSRHARQLSEIHTHKGKIDVSHPPPCPRLVQYEKRRKHYRELQRKISDENMRTVNAIGLSRNRSQTPTAQNRPVKPTWTRQLPACDPELSTSVVPDGKVPQSPVQRPLIIRDAGMIVVDDGTKSRPALVVPDGGRKRPVTPKNTRNAANDYWGAKKGAALTDRAMGTGIERKAVERVMRDVGVGDELDQSEEEAHEIGASSEEPSPAKGGNAVAASDELDLELEDAFDDGADLARKKELVMGTAMGAEASSVSADEVVAPPETTNIGEVTGGDTESGPILPETTCPENAISDFDSHFGQEQKQNCAIQNGVCSEKMDSVEASVPSHDEEFEKDAVQVDPFVPGDQDMSAVRESLKDASVMELPEPETVDERERSDDRTNRDQIQSPLVDRCEDVRETPDPAPAPDRKGGDQGAPEPSEVDLSSSVHFALNSSILSGRAEIDLVPASHEVCEPVIGEANDENSQEVSEHEEMRNTGEEEHNKSDVCLSPVHNVVTESVPHCNDNVSEQSGSLAIEDNSNDASVCQGSSVLPGLFSLALGNVNRWPDGDVDGADDDDPDEEEAVDDEEDYEEHAGEDSNSEYTETADLPSLLGNMLGLGASTVNHDLGAEEEEEDDESRVLAPFGERPYEDDGLPCGLRYHFAKDDYSPEDSTGE
jgi:hypothetical protein